MLKIQTHEKNAGFGVLMNQFLTGCFLALACLLRAENMEELISADEIREKIHAAAGQIEEDWAGEPLTVVMVMKGVICVASDLIRALKVPCTFETIRASSYGQRGKVQGELIIEGFEKLDLEGKNVLLVDDIFDSGKTMESIALKLQQLKPKSLKSLALLVKKVPRTVLYRPDYTLFEIENRFVIGYGLDYKELYRNLPGIYAFIDDLPPEP